MSPSSTSSEVVHARANDGFCDAPGRADGNALGNRAGALRVVRALDRVEHGRKPHRLHAHDLDAGLEGLGRGGDAADQAAAAHRDHEHVEVRHGLQHFQPHRALARDDGVIVVGVHEGQVLRCGELEGVGARLLQRVAMQHHLGTEAARALDLHAGGEARHHDHRAQAQALRVVGHTLRMVAGGHGHHAARALGIALSCASLLQAPRSLNDAVNCRFSNFRNTWARTICDSVRDSTQGVSSTWPCSRSAAC
jgi:hypothetical protein